MDPNACYRDLLTALNTEDHNEAYELAQHLQSWLARGGFYPKDHSSGDVDRTIANALQPADDNKA